MTTQTGATTEHSAHIEESSRAPHDVTRLYQEGLIARPGRRHDRLFVLFEFGFIAGAMLFAQPVLRALAWPAILVANLLAAAAMAGYFRLRHPNLRVQP